MTGSSSDINLGSAGFFGPVGTRSRPALGSTRKGPPVDLDESRTGSTSGREDIRLRCGAADVLVNLEEAL